MERERERERERDKQKEKKKKETKTFELSFHKMLLRRVDYDETHMPVESLR